MARSATRIGRFFCGGWSLQSLGDPVAFWPQSLQTAQVGAKHGLGLDAVLQTAQLQIEFPAGASRQGINHPLLVPAGFDHSGSAEVSQVFGHRHLGQLQDLLEMTNAQRPLLQQMQDAQPRLVTQAPVDLNHIHNIQAQAYSRKGISMSSRASTFILMRRNQRAGVMAKR